MIYYRRYLGDYLVKTIGMSMVEDGAYNRLLDYYYTTEKPLPGNIEECYEIARATKPEDKKAVKRVLEVKFDLKNGSYHNTRADAEIALAARARENGGKHTGKSGKARKEPSETT